MANNSESYTRTDRYLARVTRSNYGSTEEKYRFSLTQLPLERIEISVARQEKITLPIIAIPALVDALSCLQNMICMIQHINKNDSKGED